ncbi:hypothetical protein T12_3385 [Trichinella patagoniensis]|uniref:Uncharacterized protein n=1 Tax=Trichinella patagoniensis TaxID=990121 RepID=A0A0V0ZX14_9BILA|nr:hypothetical protein T12_3385 [Trichinella patagoniensis]
MYSSTTQRTSVVRDIVATDKTNQLSKLVVSNSTINNSGGSASDNAKTSKDKKKFAAYYSIAICHLVYTFVSNVSKVNILTFRQANHVKETTSCVERLQMGGISTDFILLR